MYIWSQLDGFKSDELKKSDETKSLLKALDFIEKCNEPAVFIIKDIHIFFGAEGRPIDTKIVRKIRDLGNVLEKSPNPKNVVFLAPTLTLPIDL